jgi:hypothetical protein
MGDDADLVRTRARNFVKISGASRPAQAAGRMAE